MASLAQIQDMPASNLILLLGPPGSGKTTFCHQTVVRNIERRPVIYVATETPPSTVQDSLRQRGLGEALPHPLGFIDAFHETVGLSSPERSDTLKASSGDLTGLGIAITKLHNRMGQKLLLIFDSLTSPYLMNQDKILRFVRAILLRFAAEGDAVLACVDEGCGREEDLVAMMSVANGILRMQMEGGSRILDIVKHPLVGPARMEVSTTPRAVLPLHTIDSLMTEHYRATRSQFQTSLRSEMGDFVNIFWLGFVLWGGMLWDPKRFPIMLYDLTKRLTHKGATMIMAKHPLHVKLLWRFVPKRASSSPGFVKKRFIPIMARSMEESGDGRIEYQAEVSREDEHHVRVYESPSCWGLGDVGAPLCFDKAAYLAGFMSFFDKEARDWNAVETTCMGEGSPYCEFKVAPSRLDEELEPYLTGMDGSKIGRITDRLMEQVKGFVVDQKPLGQRPRLGSGLHIHDFVFLTTLPALASERYRVALRMAGAVAGKRLGGQLKDLGLRGDEAVGRMTDLLASCQVGRVSMDNTIRMRENCESFCIESEAPTCFFTTAFFNGFFASVENQHVKETKCVAMGDPYCEWELE